MWTIAVSGKKKLRIQKYPDTCGRGLSENVTVSVTKQEPRGVNLVVKIKIENSNYVGKG